MWKDLLKDIARISPFEFWRSLKPPTTIGALKIIAYWGSADPEYSGIIYIAWKEKLEK